MTVGIDVCPSCRCATNGGFINLLKKANEHGAPPELVNAVVCPNCGTNLRTICACKFTHNLNPQH